MKPNVRKIAGWMFLTGMLVLHASLAWNLKEYIRKGYTDFTIFYSAGKIIRQGPRLEHYNVNLQYEVQKEFAPEVRIRQAALPYNHPPFEGLFFVPFTWLSYCNAYLAWNLFNLFILGAIPILLRRHVAILQKRPPWFWLLLSLAFFPTFMTLIQGQDSILLLLMFTLTFVFLKKNSDFTAGMCLALGLFRFHLVLPLALVFLLRNRRNTVYGFLSVACFWLVLSAGLVGWSTVIHYPQYVMHLEAAGAGGAIVPANMPSIHGLLGPLAGPFLGRLASETLVAVISCALILTIVRSWRNRSLQTDFDLQFALTIVISVLVSYHAYAHDLSLLFLPLLLVANHLQMNPTRRLALTGPMFLLCLSPLYMVLWFRYGHLNLFGLILLWWAWGLWQEIRQTSTLTPASLKLNGASGHA